MDENEISKVILDAAITVHNELGGPGLLESYYASSSILDRSASSMAGNASPTECHNKG